MRLAILVGLASCFVATQAGAWSRPGHMVTAAIAYRDLQADPAVRAAILDLLEAHPDRGPFEVAIDRTTGEARARRLFYECARWPDDARGTAYDHPTWHYAARPVMGKDAPTGSRDAIEGNAIEAFALNFRVLADHKASKAERAVALCWVMHLVGDIHQPLHTAQLFSRAYPDGDQLGSKQFVRATAQSEPVTLHWFWDDSVHQSGTQESVEARAAELGTKPPGSDQPARATVFATWAAKESYPAAAELAYRSDLVSSQQPVDAPTLPRRYVDDAHRMAEERVTSAGHRLATVLRDALNHLP